MARLLWVAARIAYFATAYTLTYRGLLEASRTLENLAPYAAARLEAAAPIIAAVIGFLPRLLPVALILAIAWAMLAESLLPAPVALAASLASVYSHRAHGGYRLGSPSRAIGTLLAALASYSIPAGLAAAGGYLAWRIATATPPRLPGEEATVIGLLNETILYRIIVVGLVSGVVFKAIYYILSLIEAQHASPPVARALLDHEAAMEAEGILGFKGRQYPVLESTVSWLTAFLVAPYLYPGIQRTVEAYAGDMPRIYLVLASTGAGLVIGWLVLRLILAPLIRHATLEALLNPRPAVIVFMGLLGVAGILSIVVILGGDPLAVVIQALTGSPGPGDPLASLFNLEPSEDYYRGLAEILDLIVRLFWGG